MNTTTLWMSGLAVSLFAAAIAVRATQRTEGAGKDWRHLPPTAPVQWAEPARPLDATQIQQGERRALGAQTGGSPSRVSLDSSK